MKHTAPAATNPSVTSAAIALPELLPHGRYLDPRHAGGVSGASTDEERSAGGLAGTVKRFRKDKYGSGEARAYGWIKATYRNAIEYSGMKQDIEGGIMMGAFLGVMVGGSLLAIGLVQMLEASDIFEFAFGLAWAVASAGLLSWLVLTPLRHTWRAPRDLPTIFDRESRRVYRMVRAVQPGLKGLFKPWPVLAVGYEWDLLDAEHDVEVAGSAATVTRLHRLAFVVRKGADDPTIIDHFEVGNAMAQGEAMVAPMWEHIRRFMGGTGPHLPHPSERLDSRADVKPTWWQACGEAGPFGSRYGWWWRHQFFLTAFYHLIVGLSLGFSLYFFSLNGSPVSFLVMIVAWVILSINWGQGTGKWLLAHTSRTYDWPQEVKDAVGPATARGAGW